MSALTVKELMDELGRVQPDRVVVLHIQDDTKQTHGAMTGPADLFTVIDSHALILKNGHPIDGANRDVLEIGLVANSPH